ncbi:MAG: metal-dependent transcriptional regulator [Candidatus Poseidoniales archaeon]
MNGHFREFEDEYLETMYGFFEKQPSQRVRNGDLAKALGVSPASATEMIQRLAVKGMVDYVPYQGAS